MRAKVIEIVTNSKQTLKALLKARPPAEASRLHFAHVQLALFLSLILCSAGSTQDGSGGNYTRTSQPAIKTIAHPVVVAGDMNATGTDGSTANHSRTGNRPGPSI